MVTCQFSKECETAVSTSQYTASAHKARHAVFQIANNCYPEAQKALRNLLSNLSKSRPLRLVMKTPPDKRPAQDLQNKTSITANKGRNTTRLRFTWKFEVKMNWRIDDWLCILGKLCTSNVGAIKRYDGGVSITMVTEMNFLNFFSCRREDSNSWICFDCNWSINR